MITSFRQMANGFVAKILLGLLVLSFAAWGIGDIFRSGGGAVVATIDGEPIYATELDQRIRQMQQQYAQLTPDIAQSLPVKLQILNQMVNTRLLLKNADEMGLVFSEDAIAERIAQDPAMLDEGGNFDAEAFKSMLRTQRISEKAFIELYSRDLRLSLLESAIGRGLNLPPEMLEVYYKIRHEQREASLVMISTDDVMTPPAPTDEQQQAYYKAHPEQYTLPEFRTLRVLHLAASELPSLFGIEIGEDAAKDYYDKHRDQFAIEGARDVLKLEFESEAASNAAYESIQLAEDKAAFIRNYPKTHAEDVINADAIEVKGLARDDAAPSTRPVFEAAVGDVLKPIATPYGHQIFYVEAVEASQSRDFDEVKEDIITQLKQEQVDAALQPFIATMDDATAGGALLEEALAKTSLNKAKLRHLGPVSATGMTPGNARMELEGWQVEMLTKAFELDKGEVTPVTLTADGDYYIAQLLEITPSALEPFADVQADVIARLKAEKLAESLAKKASDVANALQVPEHPLSAAKDMGLKIVQTGNLKRFDDEIKNDGELKGQPLPAELMEEIFSLQPATASEAYPLSNGMFAIAVLESVTPVTSINPLQHDLLRRELQLEMQTELLNAYLERLRKEYPVQIRIDALGATSDSGA